MLTLFSLLGVGFFLGMRHATDADHVIAVATIVSREKRIGAAAMIGALWGIGHTLTIMLVGGAILLFGVVIPPRVGLAMEFGVAIMLVLLGIWTLQGVLRSAKDAALAARNAREDALHAHTHAHGDYAHTHVHAHHEHGAHGHREDQTPQAWLDRWFGKWSPYQLVRPVVIGVVHGLAGSAAIALLVLTTVRDAGWGMAYLLLFGVGTVLGMMLITAVVAMPFAYAAAELPRFNARLRFASGVVSLGFGLFLMYQIGVVDGLFTAQPNWDPH